MTPLLPLLTTHRREKKGEPMNIELEKKPTSEISINSRSTFKLLDNTYMDFWFMNDDDGYMKKMKMKMKKKKKKKKRKRNINYVLVIHC
ncbi:hypothetical protein MTR_4g080760 [Medicago truncatula]|uniref:Uncharacterized protein n=1 Tax=Medicago truncatula TaxID=3880 RepID=G7JDV2_MEDTR|nr:hypothetical protein MTR_4g080760 [Medicago truncatula]